MTTSQMLISNRPRAKAMRIRPCTMQMVRTVPRVTSLALAMKTMRPVASVHRSKPKGMPQSPQQTGGPACLVACRAPRV